MMVSIVNNSHILFLSLFLHNKNCSFIILQFFLIDDAKKFVGERLDIVITGALQTPTGRMVFGKLINNPESNKSFKSPATQG